MSLKLQALAKLFVGLLMDSKFQALAKLFVELVVVSEISATISRHFFATFILITCKVLFGCRVSQRYSQGNPPNP